MKGNGKCRRDKKRIIFPFSLVKYCLLILIAVFSDVLLNKESESFLSSSCSYISCYLLGFVSHTCASISLMRAFQRHGAF